MTAYSGTAQGCVANDTVDCLMRHWEDGDGSVYWVHPKWNDVPLWPTLHNSTIMNLIHPFWYSFPPTPMWIHVSFSIFVAIVATMSTLGNLLVMVVFMRTKSLRSSGIYTSNLAASDCLSPVLTYYLFTGTSFHQIWAYGELTCKLYGFTQGFFGLMSIVTLAVISAERCYVIKNPFKARDIRGRHRLAATIAVWVYCFAVASPPVFGWSRYGPAGFLTSCCFDYLSRTWIALSFVSYLFILGFAVPVSVIVYSYAQIFLVVHRSETGDTMTKSAGGGATGGASGAERSKQNTAIPGNTGKPTGTGSSQDKKLLTGAENRNGSMKKTADTGTNKCGALTASTTGKTVGVENDQQKNVPTSGANRNGAVNTTTGGSSAGVNENKVTAAGISDKTAGIIVNSKEQTIDECGHQNDSTINSGNDDWINVTTKTNQATPQKQNGSITGMTGKVESENSKKINRSVDGNLGDHVTKSSGGEYLAEDRVVSRVIPHANNMADVTTHNPSEISEDNQMPDATKPAKLIETIVESRDERAGHKTEQDETETHQQQPVESAEDGGFTCDFESIAARPMAAVLDSSDKDVGEGGLLKNMEHSVARPDQMLVIKTHGVDPDTIAAADIYKEFDPLVHPQHNKNQSAEAPNSEVVVTTQNDQKPQKITELTPQTGVTEETRGDVGSIGMSNASDVKCARELANGITITPISRNDANLKPDTHVNGFLSEPKLATVFLVNGAAAKPPIGGKPILRSQVGPDNKEICTANAKACEIKETEAEPKDTPPVKPKRSASKKSAMRAALTRQMTSITMKSTKLNKSDSKLKQQTRKDVKTARITLIVILTFILAWTPYAIVALLGQFAPLRWFGPSMAMIPAIFAKTSTLYNPIIYAFKDTKFRSALLGMFPVIGRFRSRFNQSFRGSGHTGNGTNLTPILKKKCSVRASERSTSGRNPGNGKV